MGHNTQDALGRQPGPHSMAVEGSEENRESSRKDRVSIGTGGNKNREGGMRGVAVSGRVAFEEPALSKDGLLVVHTQHVSLRGEIPFEITRFPRHRLTCDS